MSNTVGTLARGELRKASRGGSEAGQFDAAQLVRRASGGGLRAAHAAAETREEVLIFDNRAALRPAQAVERKLMLLLDGKALSVSQLRTASFSSRSHAAFD
jgi:hypothetical protein